MDGWTPETVYKQAPEGTLAEALTKLRTGTSTLTDIVEMGEAGNDADLAALLAEITAVYEQARKLHAAVVAKARQCDPVVVGEYLMEFADGLDNAIADSLTPLHNAVVAALDHAEHVREGSAGRGNNPGRL